MRIYILYIYMLKDKMLKDIYFGVDEKFIVFISSTLNV